jgi:predicted esterase
MICASVMERTIGAATHGRYLIEAPDRGASLLVGFHGYAESAEIQMERLRAIPGADRRALVSIQGLHRFYQRRSSDVVASWMTRQDRDLAIADNLAYIAGVVDAVFAEWSAAGPVVFAGFSQGVAMAFRAASACTRPVAGVIAAGGDVPPELDAQQLARIPAALVCRGARDEWYTTEKLAADLVRLRSAGVEAGPLEFDGGHEWSADVNAAAGAFLKRRSVSSA